MQELNRGQLRSFIVATSWAIAVVFGAWGLIHFQPWWDLHRAIGIVMVCAAILLPIQTLATSLVGHTPASIGILVGLFVTLIIALALLG